MADPADPQLAGLARPLDEQRRDFASRRFLAMPLAGTIAWAVVAAVALLTSMPPRSLAIVLFIATGMIVYLGMFLSRFTGENFLARNQPKNAFDGLFFSSVAMALLAYGMAIPFYLADPTSTPLTVGILTGMMWLPFSWIIQHWIGLFHAITRTILLVALWYLLPDHRFVALPLAIVAIYGVTIAVLEGRWRAARRG